MEILCVACKKCGDKIFPRTMSDIMTCSCKKTSISKGHFNGIKWTAGEVIGDDNPIVKTIILPVDEASLFDDWNMKTNKYGLIKNKKTVMNKKTKNKPKIKKDVKLKNKIVNNKSEHKNVKNIPTFKKQIK